MATAFQNSPSSVPIDVLHSGDRMTSEEFHRVYETLPADVKAELIGGIVYMSSPLSRGHAVIHPPLSAVLFAYASRTRGTEVGDNGTILLGEDSEPQPDLFLRILPQFGGQSRTEVSGDSEYVAGAPELVLEIAHSSRAIDLHAKKQDYTRYSVVEYVVILLKERQILWFDLRVNEELRSDAEGVFRSRVFPGLWIDSRGILERDASRLMSILDQGLARPEHAEFARRLASAQKP